MELLYYSSHDSFSQHLALNVDTVSTSERQLGQDISPNINVSKELYVYTSYYLP